MSTSNEELERYQLELVEHLLAQNCAYEMTLALHKLLTDAEFNEVIKRLQIFKMLKAGVPQRQIAQKLGVGIATVSRGARALNQEKP